MAICLAILIINTAVCIPGRGKLAGKKQNKTVYGGGGVVKKKKVKLPTEQLNLLTKRAYGEWMQTEFRR